MLVSNTTTLSPQRTLQLLQCLIGLWLFKQNPSTAIFFPSVIGLLMIIRSFLLPKIFTEEELSELGDPSQSDIISSDGQVMI